MKKNILICSYSLEVGGIEKSLINLLKNIDYSKYNVDLILEDIKGPLLNDVPPQVNVMKYKPYNLKIKVIQKTLNFIKQIKYKILLKNTYDASICYATYSYSSNFLSRIASKNSILYIHSDYTKLYNKNELKQFFDSRNIDLFKHIIFVSNESKDNLVKIYPNILEKTKVINNLTDVNEILTKSKIKPDIKFNKNNINLLFVGRLDESSKNILFQLETINKLKDIYKNIRLYIIGDGPNKLDYIKYIKDNNLEEYISILGEKINPYTYMKQSDYLLLTSNYEGYPVIFNEGIVLKKDIISTIKISDESLCIGEDFGFYINKNNFLDEFKNIIDNKKHNITNIDLISINKKRIKKLEEIFNEE